jgi:hypothetical protein
MKRLFSHSRVLAVILLFGGTALILARAFRPAWRTERLPGIVLVIPSDPDAAVTHAGGSDAFWIDGPSEGKTVTEIRMMDSSTYLFAALLERRCNSIIASSHRVTNPGMTGRVLRFADIDNEPPVELDYESVRRVGAFFAGWRNTTLLVQHIRRHGLYSDCDVVAGPAMIPLGVSLMCFAALLGMMGYPTRR